MTYQQIQLNFLEISPQQFSFYIYRKTYSDGDISDGVHRYLLPQTEGDKEYFDYAISLEQRDGFTGFTCDCRTNISLTLKVLSQALLAKIKNKNIIVTQGKKFYDRRIDFTIKTHSRGQEKISLNSHYLQEEKKFGFLIDFFFKANPNEKLDKVLLQLSLALGSDGRSNRNFYSDHFHKIQLFLKGIFKQVDNFLIHDQPISIRENFH
jgi:hypothetical protein